MKRIRAAQFVVVILLAGIFFSCTGEEVLCPGRCNAGDEQEAEAPSVSVGELHNQILTRYAGGENLLLEATPREEDIRRFISAVNSVMGENDLEMRIDEQFVREALVRIEKISRESGFDLATHRGDPDDLIAYLEREGYISSRRAGELKRCMVKTEKFLNSPSKRLNLFSPGDAASPRDPALDIMEHSAQWWKVQMAEAKRRTFLSAGDDSTGTGDREPKPENWWEIHAPQIREVSVIVADAAGGAVGSIAGPAGTAVFAALCSGSVSVLWPPY